MFTPDEAEAATSLTLFPESPDVIARRPGKDYADVETLFYSMSRKGLVGRSSKERNRYMAANFIAGIWEYHVNDLDGNLIQDVNEYIPQIWKKAGQDRKHSRRGQFPHKKAFPLK